MSAMPAEPDRGRLDPVRILNALPESERGAFLAAYHQAVTAAADPERFAGLLRLWSMRAAVVSEPWYAKAREHARGPSTAGCPSKTSSAAGDLPGAP